MGIHSIDIIFTTSGFGIINSIEVDFPVDTDIYNAKVIEVSGISSEGTTTVMGQSIIYEVSKAQPVMPGTEIRLEFANVINPSNDNGYQVGVTTYDKSGELIDGPTMSSVYSIIHPPLGQTQILSVRQAEGNIAPACSEGVASCGSDEVLVGGGFRTIAPATIDKNRAEGNSWVVSGSPTSTSVPAQVQAYAECGTLL